MTKKEYEDNIGAWWRDENNESYFKDDWVEDKSDPNETKVLLKKKYKKTPEHTNQKKKAPQKKAPKKKPEKKGIRENKIADVNLDMISYSIKDHEDNNLDAFNINRLVTGME